MKCIGSFFITQNQCYCFKWYLWQQQQQSPPIIHRRNKTTITFVIWNLDIIRFNDFPGRGNAHKRIEMIMPLNKISDKDIRVINCASVNPSGVFFICIFHLYFSSVVSSDVEQMIAHSLRKSPAQYRTIRDTKTLIECPASSSDSCDDASLVFSTLERSHVSEQQNNARPNRLHIQF